MTLIKKAAPLRYLRSDADSWIDFMNDQVRNVKDYGAVGTGGAGNDAPAIQAAINDLSSYGGTIYLPPGIYPCTSSIIFPADRAVRLIGAGPGSTILHVPPGTNAVNGVVHVRGTELRSSVEQLQIFFEQPDTSDRSLLTHYIPAIYAQNVARFRVQHVRITKAWDGIDMRGNSNGEINDLEISHFNSGIQIDGSQDSIRIAHLHDWVFGMSPNQVLAQGHPLNVGLQCGRTDGLHLSNSLLLCGTGIHAFPSLTSPGFLPILHITNCQFDTFNGLQLDGGQVRIGDSYFSPRTSQGYEAIHAVTGTNYSSLLVSNCMFLSDGGTFTPLIEMVGAAGATFLHANISDSVFYTGASNQSCLTAQASAGGVIHLNIANNHFNRFLNIAYVAPTIGLGANTRATIANNIATDKGTGAGDFVSAVDSTPVIDGNTIPGWGLNYSGTGQPQGGINIGASITGSKRELLSTTGFLQASGWDPLSATSPPFAMRRFTGTLDGSGAAAITHGLPNSPQAGLLVQAWQKTGGGAMIPLAVAFLDGTTLALSGGSAGAKYRALLTYSNLLDAW